MTEINLFIKKVFLFYIDGVNSFLFYLRKAENLSHALNYNRYLYDIDRQYIASFLVIAGISASLFLFLMLLYRGLKAKTNTDKPQTHSILLQQKNLELEKQNLLLQNSKLEEEIEEKNRELTTHAMYLVQKNEFINFITNKLIDFTDGDSKTITKQQLNVIIRQMKAHIDKTTWDEFEIRFQQLHQTFYKNLNKKIPNLTPNEKRLCAFLYLNMTTKEISSITFQSIKSIEVARTRLRKKMGIDRDDNLISVLQTL